MYTSRYQKRVNELMTAKREMDEAESFINNILNGITELHSRLEDFDGMEWPYEDEDYDEVVDVFNELKQLEARLDKVYSKMQMHADAREEFLERRGHTLFR